MAIVTEDSRDTHVIHEHHDSDKSSNGMGFLIGIVLLIVVALLFLYYGFPVIRNVASPQVNVPSQVDVNINRQ